MEDGVNVLFFDTLYRYYLHGDPASLSDEEWAYSLAYVRDIRKLEKDG